MTTRWVPLCVASLIALCWCPKNFAQAPEPATGPGAGFQVFQDLEEATSRIPRLGDKPFQALIEANGGFFQGETIIFKDIETGHEVWSLSRENCTDMAHTGRRPTWSCDGRFIAFRGNMAFLNVAEGNKLWQRPWAGYTYIANADGSRRRPLWGIVDGKPRKFNCPKYNMWDAKRPGVWYTIDKETLWRLSIGDDPVANKAEAIFKFPNPQAKVIQEISDDNYMLVEESGEKANCYVVNLNKDAADQRFCLSAPLKGLVHSGSFRFHYTTPVIVTGGYEDKALGGVCYQVDPEKGLIEQPRPKNETPTGAKIEMWHLWHGPPDDRAGFFGTVDGQFGLWLELPAKAPILLAEVPDGHVTWCGRDPATFYAYVGPGKGKPPELVRKLLACRGDGSAKGLDAVQILCTPFDRRRGEKADYGALPLPIQSRDGNKCWFHSSMLLADNDHTGSYIAVFRRPYAPTQLALKSGAAGVELQWTAHALSQEIKGYHVYRSDDAGKSFLELTDQAIAGASYRDASAQAGGTYLYMVTAEEWSRLESDLSSPGLRIKVDGNGAQALGGAGPVKGWDKVAPAAVKDLKAARKNGLIELRWSASGNKDLRYYNLYASNAGRPAVSQKRLLVSPAHDDTSYIDWSAPKGSAMYYALTAVDRQGNESAPVHAELAGN